MTVNDISRNVFFLKSNVSIRSLHCTEPGSIANKSIH